ncbi:P-loop containing nucleoside triphosphate hydrolase protein, partial [Lyophyllum atratum]
ANVPCPRHTLAEGARSRMLTYFIRPTPITRKVNITKAIMTKLRARICTDVSWLSRFMCFSPIASLPRIPFMGQSAQLFVLGTLMDVGWRFLHWVMERFQFEYCVSATFTEGDPSYEWVISLLNEEKVWRRSHDFYVSAKSWKHSWHGISLGAESNGSTEYIPTYRDPQMFRWRGYWVATELGTSAWGGEYSPSTIAISIYTLDTAVLSIFVEEARARYKKSNCSDVVIHTADIDLGWRGIKHKARRPLSSIVLTDGVVESLVQDAQEFLSTEEWYTEAGIPYRRGYLLHGPPGTGKIPRRKKTLTPVIRSKAGELGLEIYTISLSSGFINDSYLRIAVSSIPKHSILLIEDIDCAFSSRDEDDDEEPSHYMAPGPFGSLYIPGRRRECAVTLSGLLNAIDGVGSEEGILFFATTNYLDRLDPALLRPGRIDMKIQYRYTTKAQASALFLRFFGRPPNSKGHIMTTLQSAEKQDGIYSLSMPDLAAKFAEQIPEHEFSTAEIQGYLLSCKNEPLQAVAGVARWVARELGERREKAVREIEYKEKVRNRSEDRERRGMDRAMGGFVGVMGGPLWLGSF